jgi:hypothetical protein
VIAEAAAASSAASNVLQSGGSNWMQTPVAGENKWYISDVLSGELVKVLAIHAELALEHGLTAIGASACRIGRSHTNVQGRPTAGNGCL